MPFQEEEYGPAAVVGYGEEVSDDTEDWPVVSEGRDEWGYVVTCSNLSLFAVYVVT